MKEVIKQVRKKLNISRDEAELVVATLLEQPRFKIYLDEKIDAKTLDILWHKIQQLESGMPIEYITNKVQFLDYSLKICPGVFIPRLETEYLTELVAKLIDLQPKRILDVGTGCGAIAIALADIFPKAQVLATDLSTVALANAAENIETLGLKERITLLNSNLFEKLSGKFDLIISNPPYIPSSRIKELPKSVKDFEPILAIDGGKQGVQFIKKLIQDGKHYIQPNGVMAIEIDEDEVSILKEFLKKIISIPFFFRKDLFGHMRYLFIGSLNSRSSDLDHDDNKKDHTNSNH
jgi:release factor glutamine methyltransferase